MEIEYTEYAQFGEESPDSYFQAVPEVDGHWSPRLAEMLKCCHQPVWRRIEQ